jgi:diguanylate cyclase (GGDEF)-like protein
MMISNTEIFNANILVVDDQESDISLIKQLLSEAGYVCVSSTMKPQEVCELHRQNHYDLILLDLQMPDMDGFQVMEGLKQMETRGYVPILVISALPDQKLRALNAGAKDFISKPFDLIEVKMRIYNMLEVRLLYKQLEQHGHVLEDLALHDTLTGLPNRRLLLIRLALAITHARRNKSITAVMFLDLDEFKQINDTLGHDAGDTLLQLISARLVREVREEDTVARLGGDEFVIALWEVDSSEAVARLVLKIIHAVSQPYLIQERDVHMTVSIGVGIYPTHGESMEALMKSADLALYEAKRSGKNNYHIAHTELLDHVLT